MSESTPLSKRDLAEINPDPKDIARFFEKVNKNGPVHPYDPSKGNCWDWTAATQKAGYGAFVVKGVVMGAHRYGYLVAHGNLVRTLQVQHTCDRPCCVNGAHLILGDTKQNADDMMNRGRGSEGARHSAILSVVAARGENAGPSKLTTAEVIVIRQLCAAGEKSLSEIGRMFGIGSPAVHGIKNRTRWAHLP